MPSKRRASNAESSDDDLLSGSDGNEVAVSLPKKIARVTPAGSGSHSKGSSTASGGAKTVAAPARRPAPAITPALPLAGDDEDDDELSQGGSSLMPVLDLVATLQGTLQRQAAQTKADETKATKKANEQRDAAYVKYQDQILKSMEKHKAEYVKHAQAAKETIMTKMAASQQAQAAAATDLTNLKHDLVQFAKSLKAGQRHMEESNEDFKSTAERILKDYEAQTCKIVDDARRKSIAEVDSTPSLGEVFKVIDNLTASIQRQLPAGIVSA